MSSGRMPRISVRMKYEGLATSPAEARREIKTFFAVLDYDIFHPYGLPTLLPRHPVQSLPDSKA